MAVGISFHVFTCNPLFKVLIAMSEFLAGYVLVPGSMTLEALLQVTFFTSYTNICFFPFTYFFISLDGDEP